MAWCSPKIPASIVTIGHKPMNKDPRRTDDSPVAPSWGALLVGHGTRHLEGQQEFLQTVAGVARAMPDMLVRPCYLELAEPTIADGIRDLVATGVERIIVAPLLLFAAGHARRDIPMAIEAARAEFPRVEFVQAGHLGCHSRLVELSAERYAQSLPVEPHPPSLSPSLSPSVSPSVATYSRPDINKGTRLLVLVGRGSLEPSALEEMERFARLRGAAMAVGDVRVCYLAMARPSLAETLAEIADSSYDAIVVQPHLLFAGDLLTTIRLQVEGVVRQQNAMGPCTDGTPRAAWWLAPHLGPSPLLVESLTDRLREAACVGTSRFDETSLGG